MKANKKKATQITPQQPNQSQFESLVRDLYPLDPQNLSEEEQAWEEGSNSLLEQLRKRQNKK